MAKGMRVTGFRQRDLFAQLQDAQVRPLQLLARVWHVLWGLPQMVVGFMLLFVLRGNRHASFRSAIVTEWGLSAGLCLGLFVFVPRGCPRSLLIHEYGHTLQSMILGPFYLLAIVAPSLVWAGAPRLQRYRSNHGYSYYRFYCERWANLLAKRVTGEIPEGWYDRKAETR